MAVAVNTNIKIEPTVKKEAQELFDSFGLTLSAAVNMFLHQCIREQAIPFRVGQPVYNEETLQAIREARQGIGLSKGYNSAAELFAALDAETDSADD